MQAYTCVLMGRVPELNVFVPPGSLGVLGLLCRLTFTCISRDVLPCTLTAVTRNLKSRFNMVWPMMTSCVRDNTALSPMSVQVNVGRGREVETALIRSPT